MINDPPLQNVYPEFWIFFGGRALVNGAFELAGSLFKDAFKYFNQQTGGLKQWFRFGKSHSNIMNVDTKGIRWGAGKDYYKKIGNPTLRKMNIQFRGTKIPLNNWRTNDPGHLHWKWSPDKGQTWRWTKNY